MSAHYALLEQETLLHINGPDTLTFLQGQTTCDSSVITADQAAAGAYCTPKGRMVCDFVLGQLGPEHYALRLRSSVAPATVSTLGKYIVFSKADINSERKDWQVVALWGSGVASALAALGMTPPGERYQASSDDGYVLIQLDEAGNFFEAWIDMEQHADHFEALQDALEESSADTWNSLQICAGLGRVEGATSEDFLPQDLNYDITGHVNFTKGCYTGQEIVARLHYRGKAKRRAYPVALNNTEALAAGTPLFNEGGSQSVGSVVNSARDGERTVCLVSATSNGLAQGLRVDGDEGPVMEPLELPYSLEV
ncbi:YgfZ/GcvT domain-containing protein [Halioglobus maricola]|uniref:CAF17-like 4Fe-4S cluster assembly/insertion protein YgfZ n=1 Tax=Halioglobus maricola TaxID=2601894 RepID=UPI00197AEE81|nr:folate-binding protein YgfZ [Halioglobus maricola]